MGPIMPSFRADEKLGDNDPSSDVKNSRTKKN